MTTDQAQITAKPVFDALVVRTKELFWSYEVPATWEDRETKETLSYDSLFAAHAALNELTADQLWQLFLEDPYSWSAADIVEVWMRERPTPPKDVKILYLDIFAGKASVVADEDRAAFRSLLLANGNFRVEIRDAIYDELLTDPEIKAEDDRRYALIDVIVD